MIPRESNNNKSTLVVDEKTRSTKVDNEENDNGHALKEPKKIVNPCINSPQHRDLHKELLFNQKIGKNVLEKCELTKVMEKRLDEQKKKDLLKQKMNRRNSFERKLEMQALKLEKEEASKDEQPKDVPEFLKIHAKVYASSKLANDGMNKSAIICANSLKS
ncbi:protein FAM107B-like protein [Dinothrombium tinctorium]|uniref:Protein FAM107B-like protein n=1 Tax=Dinothrombium tinctorium TaxID=1965070 RepID=A0A3S3PBN2_9ACAR|nr:protein FAM107B-like protein [Dinothrombium tinctorium]